MEPDAGFHLWVFEIHFQRLRQRHPALNKAVGVSFSVATQQSQEENKLWERWERGRRSIDISLKLEITDL